MNNEALVAPKGWNLDNWVGVNGNVGYLSILNEQLYNKIADENKPQEILEHIYKIECMLKAMRYCAGDYKVIQQ